MISTRYGLFPFTTHFFRRHYSSDWRTIVGLELHVQLGSKLKLLSPAARAHDAIANTHFAPFDAGLPGSMPHLNLECIDLAVKGALSLGCNIQTESSFDRKHYDYVDLPTGYQITQYHRPLAQAGILTLASGKAIRIKQIHIEHDSAKSVFDEKDNLILIDLNRCGVPLIEVVTMPDIEGSREAVETAKLIVDGLRHAGVTPGILAHGNIRIDVNVSVTGPKAPLDAPPLGERVEIKNLNSYLALRDAIEYETKRQVKLLESNLRVPKETRSFIERDGTTVASREKTGSAAYRYLPEPDLPPLVLSHEYIEAIRKSLPESRSQRSHRLQEQYSLMPEQAEQLLQSRNLYNLFVELCRDAHDPKIVYNFLTNELLGIIHRLVLDVDLLTEEQLIHSLREILAELQSGRITTYQAKMILSGRLNGENLTIHDALNQFKSQAILSAEQESVIDDILSKNQKKCQGLITQFQANGNANIDFLLGPLLRLPTNRLTPQDLKPLIQNYIIERHIKK